MLLTQTTKTFHICNAREQSHDLDKDLDSSKKKKEKWQKLCHKVEAEIEMVD